MGSYCKWPVVTHWESMTGRWGVGAQFGYRNFLQTWQPVPVPRSNPWHLPAGFSYPWQSLPRHPQLRLMYGRLQVLSNRLTVIKLQLQQVWYLWVRSQAGVCVVVSPIVLSNHWDPWSWLKLRRQATCGFCQHSHKLWYPNRLFVITLGKLS